MKKLFVFLIALILSVTVYAQDVLIDAVVKDFCEKSDGIVTGRETIDGVYIVGIRLPWYYKGSLFSSQLNSLIRFNDNYEIRTPVEVHGEFLVATFTYRKLVDVMIMFNEKDRNVFVTEVKTQRRNTLFY
jgi:hypothetical protein